MGISAGTSKPWETTESVRPSRLTSSKAEKIDARTVRGQSKAEKGDVTASQRTATDKRRDKKHQKSQGNRVAAKVTGRFPAHYFRVCQNDPDGYHDHSTTVSTTHYDRPWPWELRKTTLVNLWCQPRLAYISSWQRV